MITKKKQLQMEKDRNHRLMKMNTEQREKIAGHEQMAKVYSAYIYLLLKRLGATEDNMITLATSEIQEAIRNCETRAVKTEDGWGLYYEEYKG